MMYCGVECQRIDWQNNGHKIRCYGKKKAALEEQEKQDTPGRTAAKALAAAKA